MEKLSMDFIFKKGKYANKSVEELTNVSGVIFSMIKGGYEFEDEVLEAAHIKKNIRDVKTQFVVCEHKNDISCKPLPVETASMKQILSEINTLDNIGKDVEENNEAEEEEEINIEDE